MQRPGRNALVVFPVVVTTGAGIAVAGSQGDSTVGGMPVFACVVAMAFVIRWLVFVPASLLQDEGFSELTASLTYIFVTVMAVTLAAEVDARSVPLLVLVLVWPGGWARTSSAASAGPAKTNASIASSPPSCAS